MAGGDTGNYESNYCGLRVDKVISWDHHPPSSTFTALPDNLGS